MTRKTIIAYYRPEPHSIRTRDEKACGFLAHDILNETTERYLS